MAIESGTTERRSRRTILAGALGGVAGLLAGRFGTAERVTAASGDPLILGSLTNNSGVTGTKLSTSGTDVGLYVQQNGTGTALRGVANNGIAGFFTSANGTGISGVTARNNQFGVYGANDALSNGGGEAIRANGQQNHGLVATTANLSANAVKATSSAAGGFAIRGEATATGIAVSGYASGNGRGVQGEAVADGGVGVFGNAQSTTGTNYGVFGSTNSTTGYGVFSQGNARVDGDLGVSANLTVTGAITAGTKDFRIDHPLDPAQKFLSHSCVESDDRRTVYDGEVTLDAKGEATVTLPAWFEKLNTSFRYQLTAIGQAAPDLHIKSEVSNSRFSIAGAAAGQKVSWLMTAIRQDPYAKAHPLAVEAAKTGTERGRYLHPEVYGKPASKGIEALRAHLLPLADPTRAPAPASGH
jgi:hypothetical protein